MTCPACGGALHPWRRAPDHEPAAGGTHLLLRCDACGTAVTAGPAPSFTDAHEAGAYASGAPRGSRAAAPILRAFDRRRLALLEGHGVAPGPGAAPSHAADGAERTARGPLLDVGAGRGRFVAFARAHGWDATGIEPSGRSSASNVEAVGIEDAVIAAGSLGAITLWHVLEHVEDPASAIERLHGWLRPGGTLLVGVPNLDSVQARIAGPNWYHLDLPRHRTHFTATGIQRMLERHGFAVEHTEHVLLEHNPFGLWQSALNRVTPTPSWLFHALKRNAPLRAADAVPTALALPLIPVALAGEAAAGAAGRGGTVAVRATRLR